MVITLSVGFTLSFGCLFSKTWRIYKVFIAAKTMERVVKTFFNIFLKYVDLETEELLTVRSLKTKRKIGSLTRILHGSSESQKR